MKPTKYEEIQTDIAVREHLEKKCPRLEAIKRWLEEHASLTMPKIVKGEKVWSYGEFVPESKCPKEDDFR